MQIRAPYAAAHLIGLGDSSAVGAPYPDQSFDVPFDVTLTALQTLQTSQIIERDADFVWRGIILNANMASDPSSPYPVFPELTVPAGGRIGILITDLSNAGNTIEIVFRGVKRFKANQQ